MTLLPNAAAARAAALLARLRPAAWPAAPQLSTLAVQDATHVVVPETSAAAPAPAQPRSFYKRQLPRELVPFASTEVPGARWRTRGGA